MVIKDIFLKWWHRNDLKENCGLVLDRLLTGAEAGEYKWHTPEQIRIELDRRLLRRLKRAGKIGVYK